MKIIVVNKKVKPRPLLFKTLHSFLFTTAHLSGEVLMTGCERWLTLHAVLCATSRWSRRENSYFPVVKLKRAREHWLACLSNDYGVWCRLPQLIIHSHITLKPPKQRGSCMSSVCVCVCVESCLICTCPPEHFLGVCMPALQCKNPDWGLVIFSSCGVGLCCIKAHWGLAHSASLAVWFWCCGLVLGWPQLFFFPSWEGELQRPTSLQTHTLLQGLQAVMVQDRCLQLSATQRGSSHGGLEKLCTAFYHPALRRPFFHLLLISSFFFSYERCVCVTAPVFPFFLCASPSDSGAEVTVFKDG